MNKQTLHPASLWIGQHKALTEKTIQFLQHTLCPQQGNDHCHICQQIQQQQHHAVLWLAPEKNYTLKQLVPINEQIMFALESGHYFFFIVQHADFLTPACANSLLKSVEEPPPGYHFIFLAQRLERILPTIRSRCIIERINSTEPDNYHHDLFYFFTQKNPDPFTFEKILINSKINERESIELLDNLFSYWQQQYRQAIQNKSSYEYPKKMLFIFKQVLKKPPMPGSNKLFWKNIFLMVMAAMNK